MVNVSVFSQIFGFFSLDLEFFQISLFAHNNEKNMLETLLKAYNPAT